MCTCMCVCVRACVCVVCLYLCASRCLVRAVLATASMIPVHAVQASALQGSGSSCTELRACAERAHAACAVQGLGRLKMEVHSEDPQVPPTTMHMSPISKSVLSQPEHVVHGRQQKAFPPHAIAYLDLLHKAEVRARAKPVRQRRVCFGLLHKARQRSRLGVASMPRKAVTHTRAFAA